MKTKLLLLSLLLPIAPIQAENYLLSTDKTSLVLSQENKGFPRIQYYGHRIMNENISDLYTTGLALKRSSYPLLGVQAQGEKTMYVLQQDGNMSLEMYTDSVKQYKDKEGSITEFVMKDKIYPFKLRQFFKVYANTDVISTWVEVENNSRHQVILQKYMSACMPIPRADNWVSYFYGAWGSEQYLVEEPLTYGQKSIVDKEGVRNTHGANPSVMVSLDGKPAEETGRVYGACLAWSGNYKITLDTYNSIVNIFAGINEEASQIILEKNEKFVTPELALTYSENGKGGVSRAFHKWGRYYKLHDGNKDRDILLNSWEGVSFNVNQDVMEQMMSDFSDLGGELFVMDDGWFGDKYPRNNDRTSLGDWVICKEKLPLGIKGLIDAAKRHNIKFGIWIEPEMSNTKSELFEKHPEWVLSQDNRPLLKGRGGTQVVLDLANPEVQDFVFGVVDNLMSNYPEIAYIKWDANTGIMNYASHYLPKNKQSHIYVAYHKGLEKVLKRIRAKYPDVVMQVCASGGGRVNYGLMPYFDEYWTSDNTDALQRVFMQWGTSHFYPALGMGAHVCSPINHQTGRRTPFKYRFDVAMSGRLGMEIQPKTLSKNEREFSKMAIAAYKKIRPVVQHGDLYRLSSPYSESGVASLMYVDENKNQAAFFAYKTKHFISMEIPSVRLNGLDSNKMYRITEMTPEGKPCNLNGKVISGAVLRNNGLNLQSLLPKDYSSIVLNLECVE